MLEKELEAIVLEERDIIPFLKKLEPKDKKELVPFLKKFHKKMFEYTEVREEMNGGTYYTSKPKHSEVKRDLVSKACFVCFNKADIKKAFFNVSQLSTSDDYLENIIPWYVPKWFGEIINEGVDWSLSYGKMMTLYKKGLLQPSPALILAKLPNAIIERTWENQKNKSYYKPEALHRFEETLKEHIWLLFEEESSINNYYSYLHLDNYADGNDIWIETISNLITDNKLNRKKVLSATIYTSTKGFNQTLSGWFFDLLIKLNPSSDEILNLQNEFFVALNSPHSKVINTVLKYFKLVVSSKQFDYKIFIENVSILLNSETKSVVNSTLMILDKIAKTNKSSRILVCKKAAEALINLDEKIQLRAAKLIAKHGNSKNQELLDELSMYTDSLFHSSKQVLNEYLAFSEEVKEVMYAIEEQKTLSKENELPRYESLDDLIFFISQSIDNNEVYHLDLLLSYLPKLAVLLNKENVTKLEPIFKRSLDLSLSFDWNSQIGNLELQAAFYLNDFAEMLMKKYPLELASFRKTKNKKIKQLAEHPYFKSHYKARLKEIEHQSLPDHIYLINHKLFVKSKFLISKGFTLNLLSTPTHNPCWVHPEILINRVLAYEERTEDFELFDFQVAIGRIPNNEEVQDLDKQINKIRDREIRDVLHYHFNFLALKNAAIVKPELWIQSVLSKNKDTDLKYFEEYISSSLQKEKGDYSWNCSMKNYYYQTYDFQQGKEVQKQAFKKELNFEKFDLIETKPKSLISNIKNVFIKKKRNAHPSSIYNCMHFNPQKYYTTVQSNDGVKFLFLAPNNPSKLLSNVIHVNLKESTFYDEESKKNVTNLLKGLYQIWYRDDFKEPTYLFLAIGLICSEKVARELSAEIWIKAVAENKINSQLLGETIGKLESGEYAPLKRFTDLVVESLFNVSQKHNQSLYHLLDHMIGKMDNTPIRGVKKLLELFLELQLSFPDKKTSQATKEKLKAWKQTSSLKAVISKIKE